MTRGFTTFLGTSEVLGSLGVALGILFQIAAIGLMLVMLGAIQKKIFVRKTGFWGQHNNGWHSELTLLVMNFVILVTGGGKTRAILILCWVRELLRLRSPARYGSTRRSLNSVLYCRWRRVSQRSIPTRSPVHFKGFTPLHSTPPHSSPKLINCGLQHFLLQNNLQTFC